MLISLTLNTSIKAVMMSEELNQWHDSELSLLYAHTMIPSAFTQSSLGYMKSEVLHIQYSKHSAQHQDYLNFQGVVNFTVVLS